MLHMLSASTSRLRKLSPKALLRRLQGRIQGLGAVVEPPGGVEHLKLLERHLRIHQHLHLKLLLFLSQAAELLRSS